MLCRVRLLSTDRRPPLKIKHAAVSKHLESQLANHSRKRKKGDPKTIMLPTAQRGLSGGDELSGTDPRISMIKQLLQTDQIRSVYPDAEADLRKVTRVSDTALKLFFATGYCHNHKGPHTNNRTYFFVIPGRVTQQCYDEDCRGYKNVMQVNTPDALFC